jgi:cobalt-zinc-cadmium efflux system membrane fusion protein
MSICMRYNPFVRHLPSAALLAVCLNLLVACEQKSESAAPVARPAVSGQRVIFPERPQGIRTEAADKSASATLTLPGRLVWDEDRTVRVFTPYAGRVLRTLAQAGATVKAGQALAEIASPDFGQALADARKASTDLLLARQSLHRVADLNGAGIVADKDLQQAQSDFRRAEGENIRAQQRLTQVGATSGQNFILKAPIAGVVVDKSINPGQELRPDQTGAPLFLITDPSKLWVWMDAAEMDIAQLAAAKPGAPITISSIAYPDRRFAGTVVKSADFIDPVSRTFKLRGSVDNSQRDLKAEMFVTAAFPVAAVASTTNSSRQTVPASAIMLAGEKRYLFTQENERTFDRVEVQVVREQPGRTTVTGLADGKRIVVEGNLYLQQLVLSNHSGPPEPPAKMAEHAEAKTDAAKGSASAAGATGK